MTPAAQSIQYGRCQCGVGVTKIIGDINSPRADMINYKYTGIETDSYTIFRCKGCSSIIHESWAAIEKPKSKEENV
jgi:hypothetical protein